MPKVRGFVGLWFGCLTSACASNSDVTTVGTRTRDAAADGPAGFVAPDAFGFSVPDAEITDAVLGALGDAACATQTTQAQRLPLDLYLMLDSSLSMTELVAQNRTRWDAVRTALVAFIDAPGSAGLGVGLQYFPLIRPGIPDTCTIDAGCNGAGPCDRIRVCSGADLFCDTAQDCPRGQTCDLLGVCRRSQSYCAPAGPNYICSPGNPCDEIAGYCLGRDLCDIAAYRQPAVAVATLPGAANALVTSLGQHVPDGLTPTGPALAGAIEYARARLIADPNRKVAVVLATDGFPVSCTPLDINDIANLARAASQGTPSITTFVIGVFSPDPAEQAAANANLTTLAQGGGSGAPFIIRSKQDVTQAFLDALNAIRSTALPCEYTIPPAMQGQIDFGKVNVQFTTGAGDQSTVGHVRDRAACSPTLGGWYYDVDPTTGKPTKVIACDATCQRLRAEPNGRVDIVLGCKTIVIE